MFSMKRIYLTLLLLFAASVAYSQDLNEDQKDLRQRIIDKLDQMRLNPEIDIDGTVFFQKEGRELYVSVDPSVTSRPFLISMYYGSSYDSGSDAWVTRTNLETALPTLNSELPRVKVVIEDEYYLVSAEMYASSAVAIEKMIDDISFAVGEINSDYLSSIVEKHLELQMEIDKIKKDATVRALTVSVPVLSDSIATILGSDTVHFNMILVRGYHDAASGNGYDYRIGETEVTQRLWLAVMGKNPSNHRDDFKPGKNLPVETVSYSEIEDFLKRLNEFTPDKYNFRLPNRDEWTFAAKGGNKDNQNEYSGDKEPEDVAVYNQRTSKYVKSKKANELGIFDMSGNLYELCSDGPNGNSDEKFKMGGSYNEVNKLHCKVTYWLRESETKAAPEEVGFRIVMDLKK